MKFLSKILYSTLACMGMACSFPHAVGETTRPNAFIIQSAQAGSTTEIDDLKITDLDNGNVVYENNFESPSDATRGLNSYYWPQGGKDSDNYVLNGAKTRVENGKLILETTGFNQNGYGGYESHSEMEPSDNLPTNFRVEFTSRRLQWAGHAHFMLFRREASDAAGTHTLGGSFSANRTSGLPLDIIYMASSGSVFQDYGIRTNLGTPNEDWAQQFTGPAGSLQETHKLAVELQGNTVRFYLDDVLLTSTSVEDWSADFASKEFSYDLLHVNQTDADKYLFSNTNVRKYSEWQSPAVTYWGPTSNDLEGQLVYKFPLGGNSTRIWLKASDASWDFYNEPGGNGRGCSMLEASRDGVTWVALKNSLNPRQWGVDWSYEDNLPQELLGTSELWVRVKMYVENAPNSSYTVAQFGRSSSAATAPVFSIRAQIHTGYTDTDTDGDGVNDYREGKDGTDPNNASSFDPLSNGLVAYYSFNGTYQSGAGVGDSAIPNKTVGFVEDSIFGNAAKITGVGFIGEDGGSIEIPEPNLKQSNLFTASFWIKEDGMSHFHGEAYLTAGTATGSRYLIAHYGNESGKKFLNTEKSLQEDPEKVADYQISIDGSITSGVWNYYTIVEKDGGIRIFMNGNELYSTNTSGSPRGNWHIGRHWWDGGTSQSTRLVASISNLRIYNRALSEAEVSQLYNKEAENPNMVTVQGGTLPEGSEFAGQSVGTFQIGKYEVTWGEWKAVRDWAVANGYTDLAGVGEGSADNHPVRNVNWYDVVKWCNAKSQMQGLAPVYEVDEGAAGGRYQIVQGSFTWQQAKADANAKGGHLASITSQQEWESIQANLGPNFAVGKECWIGANDAAQEGVWQWVTGEPFAFSKWRVGEPSGNSFSEEDYASIFGDSRRGDNGDDAIAGESWNDDGSGSFLSYYLFETEVQILGNNTLSGGTVYKTGQSLPIVNSTANGYRLPLEKEWEWAAMGGVNSQGYIYSGGNELDEVAWHMGNSEGAVVDLVGDGRGSWPVGLKRGNELGLYDMSGNVHEWCWDLYDSYQRRLRGGGFFGWGFNGVKDRYFDGMDDRNVVIGFRLARNSVMPDTTAPTISLNGSNPMSVYKGTAFTDPGGVVTDDVDAPQTIQGSGTVSTLELGVYTLTYAATDAAGNAAEPVTRTINVVLDPQGDEDGDGLTNGEESDLGTNPNLSDSDGDGVTDYREQKDGTDPKNASSYEALSKWLLGYYPFNGNSDDESGHGNDAQNYGAALGEDRFGNPQKAYVFDGATSYLEAPHAAHLNALPLTVSSWFKTNGKATDKISGIVGKYSSAGWNGYQMVINPDGTLWPWYVLSRGQDVIGHYENGEDNNPAFQSEPVDDSEWHQAVFSVDSNGGKLFIDGELVSTKAWRGAPTVVTSELPLTIGRYLGQDTGYFAGTIDDVRIYDRALSAAEVSQLYCKESGEPNMVFVKGGSVPQGSLLAGQKVKSFHIARFETTGGDWREVCEWAAENSYSILGGYAFGDDNPILSVSWYDILKWCNAKSEMDGLTPVYQVNGSIYKTGDEDAVVNALANGYRLPTEKEWEWAARGGVKSKGFLYSGSNDPNEVGWHRLNSEHSAVTRWTTYPVGLKAPNELGIYDMSGNIAERTNDFIALSNSIERIQRGGFTGLEPYYGQVAVRLSRPPELRAWMGFRYAYNNRVLDGVDPVISLSEEPNKKVASNQVTFSGIVTEDSVVELQYRKGANGAWVTIPTTDMGNSTYTWSQIVTLAPGFNHIEFQAVDEAGNVSEAFSRNITYVDSLPVGSYIGVSEFGELEDESEEARALFKKTNGQLQITTSNSRVFSGTLQIDGRRIPLKGTFSQLGSASISTKIGTANCTVNLELEFTEASSYIEGTLSGISQSDDIAFECYPVAYTGKVGGIYPLSGRKAMFVGSYFGGPSSDLVLGHGYGKMALQKDASLQIAGKLADGSVLIGSQRLVRGLDDELLAPIFVPLTASKALIKGQLSVNGDVGENFASGIVTWVRSANSKSKIYPDGVSAELWIESSLWNLTKGVNLLTGTTGGTRGFHVTVDSNALVLDEVMSLSGSWPTTNKPVLTDSNNQKVTFNASITTGDFSGRCTVDFNGKSTSMGFQGQLFTTPLQSASGEILHGAGYMMINGKSVPVEITTPFQ